jgi:hypothetical protein
MSCHGERRGFLGGLCKKKDRGGCHGGYAGGCYGSGMVVGAGCHGYGASTGCTGVIVGGGAATMPPPPVTGKEGTTGTKKEE